MNDYEKAINWLCDQCYHLKIEHGNRCEWVGSCTHKKVLQELVKNNDKLEKALDKACQKLEEDGWQSGIDDHFITMEEWKEWCLKDEKDE